MSKLNSFQKRICKPDSGNSEKGASLVIAILILLILMGFVTLVVSRVATETILTANDSSENRAFSATMGQLESTTRDFADVFERKLSPTQEDTDNVAAKRITSIPGFENYRFDIDINRQSLASVATEVTGNSTYAGLYALRDEYSVDVTTTDNSTGVQTQIRRRFFNDRIPIYQFGIFFEDDLELNRPPLFTFGGRVHTNQNLFLTAGKDKIYFRSKATAVGELVNDIWKTKTSLSAGTDDQNGVFVTDAGGTFRELNTGKASVKCVNPSGTNVFAPNPKFPNNANLPNCSRRTSWDSEKSLFQGNLDTNVPRLDLPLYRLNVDLNELIKRGKNVGDMARIGTNISAVTAAQEDVPIISRERFANKEGLRITMADSQQKLPGCAAKTGTKDDCGVRLDQSLTINGTSTIGYQPPQMKDGYKATPFNATRLAQTNKEIWIKVEVVGYDYGNDKPVTKDATAEFLSLGVTERPLIDKSGTEQFDIDNYSKSSDPSDINSSQNTDIRSIIKLQRFTIPGVNITSGGLLSYVENDYSFNKNVIVRRYYYDGNYGGTYNSFSSPLPRPSASDEDAHIKRASITAKSYPFNISSRYTWGIVPFPIEIYDDREGIPNNGTTFINAVGSDNVTSAGVMSMIDIDVANLRRFFEGDFNGKFPTSTVFTSQNGNAALTNASIPNNKGWVLYVSDRRGDADFDGEYDMEDVFPDGVLQYNENVNGNKNSSGNGILDTLYYSSNNNYFEAPRYTDNVSKARAATTDHGYYRRGVRLINAKTLPGKYDAGTPEKTLGFTVASENGVYVQGNYNATGVGLSGTTSPAPSTNYYPQNSATHIPASIVADAVTILSNDWEDSRSFQYAYDEKNRKASATQVRFAMLAGDGITGNTSISYTPSQFGQLNGGVHNFKRYLESWDGVRLNYAGSLVNLFNSRNNNGFFKCCDAVYIPPIRDWTFDTTFLDPNRLPPGTPYIYSLSFTGFQRLNN